MGATVAGKIGHLVSHAGRDHARRVVPTELRAIVGKPELHTPLGCELALAFKPVAGHVNSGQSALPRSSTTADRDWLHIFQRCRRNVRWSGVALLGRRLLQGAEPQNGHLGRDRRHGPTAGKLSWSGVIDAAINAKGTGVRRWSLR